ncbi:hypothetical protein BGZ46_008838 [Entomortierella lignicola]|nr:hypothetical protein BGZ46_008838 [Entomortierella lignicola]
MYTTSNFRYLRISKTKILPVNLLLSKEDLEWFNDYTFQEILTVLKPLLLGRIELYEQGHVSKRSIAPTSYNNQNLDDSLDDAGVILGGDVSSAGQSNSSEATSGSNTSKGKRRRDGAEIVRAKNQSNRPQFCIRYGMRPVANSERGGAILIADKKLGFSLVKEELSDDTSILGESSQRLQMDLAVLEGEAGAGNIVVREEDESDNLRPSDFQRAIVEDEGVIEDEDSRDNNQRDQQESKRKKLSSNTKRKGQENRTKDDINMPSSQSEQKPTLQVNYSPLKLYPQTLFIVVRSLDSETSSLPLTVPVETTSTLSNNTARLSEELDDENSLFPPGLDYFLS